ncbi:anthranilate synthase [Flindersiella endophytica]
MGQTIRYVTGGGITVHRTAGAAEPEQLSRLTADLDHRRGGVLSSGVDYPGRYSRWHVGYVDPPLELVARGRTVTVRALNSRGRVLVPALAEAVDSAGRLDAVTEDHFEVYVPAAEDATFAEEDRTRQPTVFSVLRAIADCFASDQDDHLGLFGAYGYDLAFQFEPVRLRHQRPEQQRDFVLHIPDQIVVLDRKRETCTRYDYEFAAGDRTTEGLPRRTPDTPVVASRNLPEPPVPGAYAEIVQQAKEKFRRGDLFEVTPSHVVHGPCDSPAAFYERLRAHNPAPYEFLFNLGEGEYLVGASPEMYVRVQGSRIETCPIAGTIRRGDDALGDAEQIRTLLNSVKDESELTMCTDVDRNDKSRICRPGSVRVIGRRQIELYRRLIHTVDHIEGELRPKYDAFDAFLTHMWAVTVTGAPKQWSMQFIEDHEETPRGWYGAAVGFVGFDGSMNTGLTLRTANIRGGIAAVRVGATLLHDSEPDEEERETHLKARALLDVVSGAAAPDVAASAETAQPGKGMRVLVVDYQDSFVLTLADYFRQHGADVVTHRFGFPESLLDELRPDLVVLSPGPGRPADFDAESLLRALDARGLPVFGVCLGLQAMVEADGGELRVLPAPAHGKPGSVDVLGGELLAGLEGPLTGARYHSIYARPEQVKGYRVTAVTQDASGETVAMAIEDPERRRWGVQFHPESILTAAGRTGHQVVANVLRLCRAAGQASQS